MTRLLYSFVKIYQKSVQFILVLVFRRADLSQPPYASVTFGRVDPSCSDEWAYIQQTDGVNWEISFSEVTLRSGDDENVIATNVTATVNLTDLYVRIPASKLQPLLDITGAKPDPDSKDRFLVDCERAGTLPNMTLHAGEKSLTLTASDYVIKACFSSM